VAQLSEKELTKQIVELLRSCGWYVIRTHQPGQWATQPGVADLIAVDQSRFDEAKGYGNLFYPQTSKVAFIEVKGPRGKVSTAQLAFLAEMESRGHIAFVAESIEQVIDKLALPVLIQ